MSITATPTCPPILINWSSTPFSSRLERMTSRTLPHTLRALLALVFLALSACAPAVQPAAATPVLSPSAAAPAAAPTPAPSPTPTLAPELNVPESALRGITVDFRHPWVGAVSEQVAAQVAEFNRTNAWGIVAQPVEIGDELELFRSTSEAIMDGTFSGVVAAPIGDLAEWQRAGDALVDLNAYIYHPLFGLQQTDSTAFYPPFVDADVLNGARLGLPALRTAQVLFYNQTWAQELGFPYPPDTPEAFQKQMCAALQANLADDDRDNDGTGGWLVRSDDLTLLSWMRAFGLQSPLAESDGYNFSAGALPAYEYLRGLYDSGCAWVGRQSTPYDYFATRKSLAYAGSLEEMLPQGRTMDRKVSADEWLILPFPSSDQAVVLTTGPSYAILRSSPEQQMAAWLFVRWMLDPARQARLVEASASLPLSPAILENTTEFQRIYPRWAQALPLVDLAVPSPWGPNWPVTRLVLEDSGWSLFGVMLTPTPMVDILNQLDATANELLTPTP